MPQLEKPAEPAAKPAAVESPKDKRDDGGIKVQAERTPKGTRAPKRQAAPGDKLRPFSFQQLGAFEKLSVPIPGKMGDLPTTIALIKDKRTKITALQKDWEAQQKQKEAAAAVAAAAPPAAAAAAAPAAAAAAPAAAPASPVRILSLFMSVCLCSNLLE